MTILVATASRHHATQELGEALGAQLRVRGLTVQFEALSKDGTAAADPADFEAVVLGSAVYMGRWQPAARRFAATRAAALRRRPVWLFSSGSVSGSDGGMADSNIEPLIATTGALGHRSFGGRLDRQALGRFERAMVSLIGATDGDRRNWAAVRDWADEIAVSLRPQNTTGRPARSA